MQHEQFRSKRVNGNMVLRLKRLQKTQNLTAHPDLIGSVGIECVEQYNRVGSRIFPLQIKAIREDIGWQRTRDHRGGLLCGEVGDDALLFSLVVHYEVFSL